MPGSWQRKPKSANVDCTHLAAASATTLIRVEHAVHEPGTTVGPPRLTGHMSTTPGRGKCKYATLYTTQTLKGIPWPGHVHGYRICNYWPFVSRFRECSWLESRQRSLSQKQSCEELHTYVLPRRGDVLFWIIIQLQLELKGVIGAVSFKAVNSFNSDRVAYIRRHCV